MSAENDLGMSIEQLKQHEYCMTEGQLTRSENKQLISRLTDIIQSRPQDVRFNSSYDGSGVGYASIDGIQLAFNSQLGLQMTKPAMLAPWFFESYRDARPLFDLLHNIRHRHHNSTTVHTISEAVGVFVAQEAEPQAPVASTEAEVSRLKKMVDEIVAHPVEMAGAVAFFAFIGMAAHFLI